MSQESSCQDLRTVSLIEVDQETQSVATSALENCISLPIKFVSTDGQITYFLTPISTGQFICQQQPQHDLQGGNDTESIGPLAEATNATQLEQVVVEPTAEVTVTSADAQQYPTVSGGERGDHSIIVGSPNQLGKCQIVVKRDNVKKAYSEATKKVNNVATEGASQHAEEESVSALKRTKPVKKEQPHTTDDELIDENGLPTKVVEGSIDQVRARFAKGCKCDSDNCFEGFSPEFVYRHRLNIAELTRTEHYMYLMGVVMATAANPEGSLKNAKRQRLKTSYTFLGNEVCLEAWLYLENCTLHQLKTVRKHLLTNGVSSRVHGNQGRKPHNTFPLESYQLAVTFLDNWFNNYVKQSSSEGDCRRSGKQKQTAICLPPECTRKKLHQEYKKYFEEQTKESQVDVESRKLMGYSTFRQFLQVRFPHVRFAKVELNNAKAISQQQASKSSAPLSAKETSMIIIKEEAINENNSGTGERVTYWMATE